MAVLITRHRPRRQPRPPRPLRFVHVLPDVTSLFTSGREQNCRVISPMSRRHVQNASPRARRADETAERCGCCSGVYAHVGQAQPREVLSYARYTFGCDDVTSRISLKNCVHVQTLQRTCTRAGRDNSAEGSGHYAANRRGEGQESGQIASVVHEIDAVERAASSNAHHTRRQATTSAHKDRPSGCRRLAPLTLVVARSAPFQAPDASAHLTTHPDQQNAQTIHQQVATRGQEMTP